MNLEKELKELLVVSKAGGNKRNVVMREFEKMSVSEKSAFVDEFNWRIIQTINPKNYVE